MKRYNKGDKVVSKKYFDIDINGYSTQICEGDIGTVDWDSGDEIEVYFGDYVRLYVGRQDIEPYVSEPEEEVTIDGWVARNNDNSLYLFKAEPWYNSPRGYWDEPMFSIGCFSIPSELFPQITFDNSPMEVEIAIKPKKR